ncbi:MAG: hypothetical protein JW965_09815 [Bacteroidales bacterium]|nr:hypothetical protein [Bacteroidales bacterium]
MKKFLFKSLSVLMAFVLLVAQSHILSAKPLTAAIPSMEESVFTLDQNALDAALSELNELDNYLAQNEGVTYSDLEAAGSELITNISDIAAPMGIAQDGDPLLGIPPFWWGCVLGWVGWLLVYVLTDKDKVLTKQAFHGCLISSAISVAFSVVYWVVLAGEIY